MDCLITYAISINFLSFPISLNSPLERSVLPRSSFGLVQQVTVIVPSGPMTNGTPSSLSLMVRYSRLVLQLYYAIIPLRCLPIEARSKRRISGQFLAEVVLLQASNGEVQQSLFYLCETALFFFFKATSLQDVKAGQAKTPYVVQFLYFASLQRCALFGVVCASKRRFRTFKLTSTILLGDLCRSSLHIKQASRNF